MRLVLGGRSAGGLGGRLAGTLFGAVFLIIGLVFTAFIGRESVHVVRVWTTWVRVPCAIVDSGASLDGDDERPYRFEVRYRYRWKDEPHEATTFRKGYRGSQSFRPVQRLLLSYPPGGAAHCYVDPTDPARAVLQRRSPAFVLLILFPLVFVVVGVVTLVATWSRSAKPEGAASLAGNGKAAARVRKISQFVSGIFLAAGLCGAAAMAPWMAGPIRARSWEVVPARVLSSTVRRHESRNDDGETSVTWKLDILYTYRYRGVTYRSNRYGFVDVGSSGRASKAAVARRYPPGTSLEVRVNPRDPTMAVVEPGYTLGHLLFLIPLAAVALGAAGLQWARRKPGTLRRGMTAPSEQEVPGVPAGPDGPGPLELAPQGRRLRKVAMILMVAVVWNGLISVFLWRAAEGLSRGRPDWFLTAFMVPFVLVGLLLIGASLHALLALANPRTTLIVEPSAPRLGGRLQLQWRTTGAVGRVRDFRIVLEGREEATYRRGKNTTTDREVFARFVLARVRDSLGVRQGRGELEIPGSTMHSFDGGNNRIVWELRVEADIPHWPDVDDSWQLVVLPPESGGGMSWSG